MGPFSRSLRPLRPLVNYVRMFCRAIALRFVKRFRHFSVGRHVIIHVSLPVYSSNLIIAVINGVYYCSRCHYDAPNLLLPISPNPTDLIVPVHHNSNKSEKLK